MLNNMLLCELIHGGCVHEWRTHVNSIRAHTHSLFESSRSIENHHENCVDYSFVV